MTHRGRVAVMVLVAVSLGVWTLAARSSPAAACSCGRYSSDGDEIKAGLDSATAIFAGEVVSIRALSASQSKKCRNKPFGEWVPECDALEIRLHVLHAWRGVRTPVVSLWTSRSGASCRYPFEVGSSYFVYAEPLASGDGLRVGRCSRTRRVSEATVDRQYLGEPTYVPRPHRKQ